MDIDTLIKRLYQYNEDWEEGRTQNFFEVFLDCKAAATALSTLQSENEKLRAELDRMKAEWDKYQPREHWDTLNELCKNLHDELEQVKAERDAAVADVCACDQAESNQEAKSDSGKPRPSLVQPALIRADMGVREYGCQKYHKPDNWRNVEAARYWDALLRHVLAAWDDWRATDPESGLPHLHHIICNAGFLAQYMEDGNG